MNTHTIIVASANLISHNDVTYTKVRSPQKRDYLLKGDYTKSVGKLVELLGVSFIPNSHTMCAKRVGRVAHAPPHSYIYTVKSVSSYWDSGQAMTAVMTEGGSKICIPLTSLVLEDGQSYLFVGVHNKPHKKALYCHKVFTIEEVLEV